MTFFFATIGELIIVQLCVLGIWLGVLKDAIKHRESGVGHRKLLTTSLGLVFNAVGIIGVLGWRVAEYILGAWPFVWGITAFYAVLAAGGILFIITPALGGSLRSFMLFVLLTCAWTAFCAFSALTGFAPWL